MLRVSLLGWMCLGVCGSASLAFAQLPAAAAPRASLAISALGIATDLKPLEGPAPLERRVVLDGAARSRRAALSDVCRQAGLTFKPDTQALSAAGFDLDESITLQIRGEPLANALGRIVDFRSHPGVFREIRNGELFLTTMQAHQARTLERLPDWLKPFYTHGLVVNIDPSGEVISLFTGEVMNDELLARLKTLSKLRELDIEATKYISPAGLAHLASLPALEKLMLYAINRDGAGLGDDALRHVSEIKSLRELKIIECGTTDAGIRFLENMPQLTRLEIRPEGKLTDTALVSIAKLKKLKHLDLSSYVGSVAYGRMRFTAEGLRPLSDLHDLETLGLVGHAPSPDFFAFPKLKSLSVGDVGDAAAARIAQCKNLEHLELMYTDVTDAGLKQLATLPRLRRLSLSSAIISDAGVAHFKHSRLEHVELRAINVSDEALKHLAEIKTLSRLDLSGAGAPGVHLGKNFTAAGIRQLKGLPELRTLWLTNFAMQGDFKVLKELPQLRELSLMMTDIRQDEFDDLEEALPDTWVHASSGGGSLVSKKEKARLAK